MWLKSFRLLAGNQEVRHVKFKKGLNLVIDSPTAVKTESGNNIGKTTFLRAIDYCLGSDGANIYEDREFKTPNEAVLSFLKEKNAVFELTVEGEDGEIVISRPWEGVPLIDDVPYTIQDFRGRLNEIFFNLNVPHPSFRQMIGKFVRIEPHQISNTIKFVYHGTPDDYDPIYLYLFGFDNPNLLEERYQLINSLSKLLANRAALKNVPKAEVLDQIKIINLKIAHIEELIRKFEIGPAVTDEIQALQGLRSKISEISRTIDVMYTRKSLNLEAKKEFEHRKSLIRIEEIEALYKEAQVFVEKLHKAFEETLEFHNMLIEHKIKFIAAQIEKDEKNLKESQDLLSKYLKEEKELLRRVAEKGALADYDKLQKSLAELFEKRGQQESIIVKLKELGDSIKKAKGDIGRIEESIVEYESQLKFKVAEFNKAFAEYSGRLYGETYELVPSFKAGRVAQNFNLMVKNVAGNEGSGKKRAQIVAFDLAYLQMAAESKSKGIRFTLHDKIEEIHENQIGTLCEISSAIDGQYVVAVLRDKLKQLSPKWIRDNMILELSQQDKFFKF